MDITNIDGAVDNIILEVIDNTTIRLSWVGVKDASGYNIYLAENEEKDFDKIADTNNTFYFINNVSNAKRFYQIKAYDGENEVLIGEVEVEPNLREIEPVTRLRAVCRDISSITISWNASRSNVDGYRVYRSTSIGGPYTLVTTTTNLQFINNNLAENIVYYYEVVAFDGNVVSTRVGPVQSTTCNYHNCCCNIRDFRLRENECCDDFFRRERSCFNEFITRERNCCNNVFRLNNDNFRFNWRNNNFNNGFFNNRCCGSRWFF